MSVENAVVESLDISRVERRYASLVKPQPINPSTRQPINPSTDQHHIQYEIQHKIQHYITIYHTTPCDYCVLFGFVVSCRLCHVVSFYVWYVWYVCYVYYVCHVCDVCVVVCYSEFVKEHSERPPTNNKHIITHP